jgi:AcrR family transcriptional regulator
MMMKREEKRQIGREAVLAAAERLLRGGATAEFSMRDLAAEAGVSFATPFNQFGNKAAIMQALSARRIDAMAACYQAHVPEGGAIWRVLALVQIAAEVLLEEPAVNRPIIGSLGEPNATPGRVSAHSRKLWSLALGEGDGLAEDRRSLAQSILPDQLTFCFRGCISFWGAGEIIDAHLVGRAREGVIIALLGFAKDGDRKHLLEMLRQ